VNEEAMAYWGLLRKIKILSKIFCVFAFYFLLCTDSRREAKDIA
jgi:hypothetical protein